jgi:hypothetical protein
VLRYTFNARVLHFNLLLDSDNASSDETGFFFRDKDARPDPRYLKLTELVAMRRDPSVQVELEYQRLQSLRQVDLITNMSTEKLIRRNLVELWQIFVDTNVKSIAYFPVTAEDEGQVNEVFRRLNIGGIALTQVELVLSEIKKVDPSYEEQLWKLSDEIRKRSYIEFSSAEILQFFHLMDKETIRIDASRFNSEDARRLLTGLTDQDALIEFFEGYLWGLFKINHASIVPRWRAILPLAIYLTALKRAGRRWRVKELTGDHVSAMNTYFLLAQFCDWSTQTMVNAFANLTANAGVAGAMVPIEAIRQIAMQKNRTGTPSYQQFVSLRWLALKVLTPGRTYVFHENKPQLDHIFPLGLADADERYKELVDVLWNLQPIPDGINNFKRARDPQEFFNSQDGAKYWQAYDFIPEPYSPIWDNPADFIQHREKQMRLALRELYGLELEHVAKMV